MIGIKRLNEKVLYLPENLHNKNHNKLYNIKRNNKRYCAIRKSFNKRTYLTGETVFHRKITQILFVII